MKRAAALLAMSAALLTFSCTPSREVTRPSILLFVADTARDDIVMELLADPKGMPTLARLAQNAMIYDNAYATAPWTLPSHASLFTGMLPSEHGVGVTALGPDEEAVLLAEQLRAAGYQTRGLSENAWLSPESGLTRGFERFERRGNEDDFEGALAEILEDVEPARPLFLFVNVMDAHGVYRPHGEEPFLTGGPARRRAIGAGSRYQKSMCRPMPGELRATLLALYRGGLSRADAKLAHVLAGLDRVGHRSNLISVATSDHGQHFGEHELVGHLYSVREELIRVPLIVSGTPGPPGRVETPVDLRQLHTSILGWAGVENTSRDGLPEREHEPGAIAISQFFDTNENGLAEQSWVLEALSHQREPCRPEHHVFGGMQTVVAYPNKLIEYDGAPPQLYDLAVDPGEHNDLASLRPDTVAQLRSHLPPPMVKPRGSPDASVSGETIDRLRALGYLPEEPTELRPEPSVE